MISGFEAMWSTVGHLEHDARQKDENRPRHKQEKTGKRLRKHSAGVKRELNEMWRLTLSLFAAVKDC